ncbi:helix-turn-helix domain-containing protein [Teredinibacter turnerae]|uniref:helix-turn-helix domain-containing protein n=1 Tax=Teredinibacter turnerae TaxID=2426 RepID=UPI0003699306|nr:helix-turn-helix transcriptional regulator [Teredinibacter turnerae]
MILKKLRENKQLSQEQLAAMSGLSVRTIQRIEGGSRASLESLKSLASVLETNVSTLQQEIVVIDKTTDKWKRLPLLFRLNFVGSEIGWLGLSRREQWIRGEKQTGIFGLALTPFSFIDSGFFVGALLIVSVAYAISFVTRMGDHYSIW